MNNETLSVKEFAAAAKIKQQTVYKQLKENGRLFPYVIIVNGKKRIRKEALIEFYNESQPNSTENQLDSTQIQPESQPNSTQIQPESQPNSTPIQPDSTESISKELIEMLKDEIRKKDQQIELLQADLKTAQADLRAAYTQIAEMGNKAQFITAADKTERIMQQQSKDDIITPVAAENQNTEEKSKRKWYQFWKW